MKKVIIAGVVVVVIVLLMMVLASSPQEATQERTNTALDRAETQKTLTEEERGSGSLITLLAAGKRQECTFTMEVGGKTQEITAFYDKDKARMDALVVGADGTEIGSYTIMDKGADTMYVWSDAGGVLRGMKMPLSKQEAPTPEEAATVSPTQNVDYRCKSWGGDNSIFVPPQNVTFMDMDTMQDMMQSLPKTVPSSYGY